MVAMFGTGLYEKHLEGRFKVSVWRVFCDSWSKLVSVLVPYCCSFAFFFLWIYYDVPRLFGHSWLHPFRSVFDLLLLRLCEEICQIDTISELQPALLRLSAMIFQCFTRDRWICSRNCSSCFNCNCR